MAHFFGEIQGNRGAASRSGSADSGLSGHIRGWRVGAAVEMRAEDKTDICNIYATTGSTGRSREFLGTLVNNDGELVLTPSAWLVDQVQQHADGGTAHAVMHAKVNG